LGDDNALANFFNTDFFNIDRLQHHNTTRHIYPCYRDSSGNTEG
jgi:hypothetical protein